MFILLAKGNYLIRAQLASCSFTIASRIILQKSCDFVFRKQRQRARARAGTVELVVELARCWAAVAEAAPQRAAVIPRPAASSFC